MPRPISLLRPLSLLVLLLGLGSAGCAIGGEKAPPMKTETGIDLPKFMGDWYVIAAIPLSAEKNAYNAIESYKLLPDGSIHTDYRMRDGSFTGKLKTYTPHAFPDKEQGNAVWGMRLAWYLPFKAEYRIAFVEPDYSATIIARSKRDYVWLMARTPQIDAEKYARYEKLIADLGYDPAKLRKVPQQWPEPAPAGSAKK